MEKLDESDQFILGRDFIRNIDVTTDLAMRCSEFKTERKNIVKPINFL